MQHVGNALGNPTPSPSLDEETSLLGWWERGGGCMPLQHPRGKLDRAAMNKGVYRVHLNVYISQSTGVSFEGRPGLCAPPAVGRSLGSPPS